MKNNKTIIMTVVFLIIMLLIGLKFYASYKKMDSLENEIETLTEKIEKTEAENEQLKDELDNLNDLEYIEKIARKKLGLVKPGEVLLIPVEENEENKEENKE